MNKEGFLRKTTQRVKGLRKVKQRTNIFFSHKRKSKEVWIVLRRM